jgi:hypothetical protein
VIARRVEREPANLSESVVAIRPKNRFWLMVATDKPVKHENFFIAKICDSESAHAAFRRRRRLAVVALTQQSIDVRFVETAAAQSFPVYLTNGSVDLSGTFCIADRKRRDWFDRCARRAIALLRQHFLKRALFFSSCWCIPDAVHLDSRVHAANKPSHYIGGHYG